VTRYATQTGHFVSRRAGWDCHGLPVEFEIDKTLGITSREQVLEMGIGTYNAHCRGIVTRYTKEWETTVTRLGRWIDFKNDYKTMQPEFMESVWWVFQELFKKVLVYQGYKVREDARVGPARSMMMNCWYELMMHPISLIACCALRQVMPYSTACGTPLSNFEAGLNYKEVEDPTLVCSFPVMGWDPVHSEQGKAGAVCPLVGSSLLAWTTTPWTLPSNLSLCVNETFDYVKVVHHGHCAPLSGGSNNLECSL